MKIKTYFLNFAFTNSLFIRAILSNEIALGHSLGGDVLRLPVTFQFRKWEEGTSGTPATRSPNPADRLDTG